jgi:hypothetical protein
VTLSEQCSPRTRREFLGLNAFSNLTKFCLDFFTGDLALAEVFQGFAGFFKPILFYKPSRTMEKVSEKVQY